MFIHSAAHPNRKSIACPQGRVKRCWSISRAFLAAPLGINHLTGVVEPPPGVVDYALWVVGGVIVFVMAGFYVWGMIKRRR